jgi:hypothetical protein
MRLTLPAHHDFGPDRNLIGDDLSTAESWDALRIGTGSGPFSLPAARAEWERAADQRHEIRERARKIDAWLEEQSIRRLVSYGVGGAVLELWLSRLRPERELVITEYAPLTITRLAEIFPEAGVQLHDLLVDAPVEADLHLFHRIGAEFTNSEWKAILRRFQDQRVLFVAEGTIDWRAGLKRFLAPTRKRRSTRTGYMRNRAAYEALWERTHSGEPLRVYDLEAWSLEPRH